MAAARSVLLGDVGGTNARLALFADGRLGTIRRFEVADHPDPIALFRQLIAEEAGDHRPDQAVFAVAGPIADDGRSVQVTNAPWFLAADRIEVGLGMARVRLVNDFAAIAWSLPRLGGDDLLQIGPGEPMAGAHRTVVGPGTGLGVAHLVSFDGRPSVIATEGGHATMAPADDYESAILDRIRARFGHVSGERVLAGEGLVNLHQAVAALAGGAPHANSAGQVTSHAQSGCAECGKALELFLSLLGNFAGSLALVLDARGGVFIAGGIVPRIADRLAASPFRARFEAKGRHSNRMRLIPTYLIRKADVAFEGLISLAEQ
jgi:glucokinase